MACRERSAYSGDVTPSESSPPRALALAAPVADTAAAMSGTVQLRVGGEALAVSVTVPADPVPLAALLPVFQGLADAIVETAARREAAAGRAVTCRAGCGACCRQIVPVSPSEARGLAALVAALPPGRRAAIEARFAAARAAGEALFARTRALGSAALDDIGLAYFGLGIACPFLEAEACSIYPDRPLICREFLATSPPVECQRPGDDRVVGVPGTAHASQALTQVDASLERHDRMPLYDALAYTAAQPSPPAHPGPALVQAVFARLADG